MQGFSDREVRVGHRLGLRWFHLAGGKPHGLGRVGRDLYGHFEYQCLCGKNWYGHEDDETASFGEWRAAHQPGTMQALTLHGAYGPWQPGENIADCGAGGLYAEPHTAPHRLCKCGFWAYWKLGDKQVNAPSVVGLIKGYGTTIVGDLGFRCSHAKIIAIFMHNWDANAALTLNGTYAPVYDSLDDMLAAHPAPDAHPPLGEVYFTRRNPSARQAVTAQQAARRLTQVTQQITETAKAMRAALEATSSPCQSCGAQVCGEGQPHCLPCHLGYKPRRPPPASPISGKDALAQAHKRREGWAQDGRPW